VIQGPLSGAEGILECSDPEKGMLILSVELLQRSIALQIDCTMVCPA